MSLAALAVHLSHEINQASPFGRTCQDALWSGLLLDAVALPEYIRLNQDKLASAYTSATSFLKRHAIPYRPSNAAHFIWIDLRKFLPARNTAGQSLEGMAQEEELASRLQKEGVVIVSWFHKVTASLDC